MADLKISEFTDGGAVQTDDEIAAVRGGINTKVSVGTAAGYDVGTNPTDIPDVSAVEGIVASQLSEYVSFTYDSSGEVVFTPAPPPSVLADGDYGDVTVSSSGAEININPVPVSSALGLGSAAFLTAGNANGNAAVTQVGTFTPTLVGSTSAGTPVYTIQNGKYIKVGGVINFAIFLQWTSLGGATGNMTISFADIGILAGTSGRPGGNVNYYNGLSLSGVPFLWWVANGGTTINLVRGTTTTTTVSGAAVTHTELTDNGDLTIFGSAFLV